MMNQFFSRASLRRSRQVLVSAGSATGSQRVSLAAAGCAFYATLALFPSITMLISLYGLAFNPHTVQPQLHYLKNFMPAAAFSIISQRINALVAQPVRGLGIGFIVSLLVSLISSSSGTRAVLNALTLAYDETDTRSFIRFQMIALGLTLVAVIGAALAIGILVLIPILITFVGLSGEAKILVALLGFLAMVTFVVAALGLLYRFGPAGTERVFYAPGAAVATLLWLLGSWAFGFYVANFAAYSVTYGPLATLIGLMMWFYLTAYAVIFGAEVNAALDRAANQNHPLSNGSSSRNTHNPPAPGRR